MECADRRRTSRRDVARHEHVLEDPEIGSVVPVIDRRRDNTHFTAMTTSGREASTTPACGAVPESRASPEPTSAYAGDPQAVLMSAAGRVRRGKGTELGLRLHMVASRWEVRAQNELALEPACLDATVRVGDLVERNPLGDARPDRVSCKQSEKP